MGELVVLAQFWTSVLYNWRLFLEQPVSPSLVISLGALCLLCFGRGWILRAAAYALMFVGAAGFGISWWGWNEYHDYGWWVCSVTHAPALLIGLMVLEKSLYTSRIRKDGVGVFGTPTVRPSFWNLLRARFS